jgi:hypothetical protein
VSDGKQLAVCIFIESQQHEQDGWCLAEKVTGSSLNVAVTKDY